MIRLSVTLYCGELLQQFNLQLFRSLWKSLSCWPSFRTCLKECQTTGIIGDNIISHCQNKENDTSVGGSWYDQEQIYMQWKQLNCRADCRYFCMMQREGERQSLGMTPVKYHGKWPFLRISVFQVCLLLKWSTVKQLFILLVLVDTSVNSDILHQEPLSTALSAINLLMHFTGWISFYLLVKYKLPLRPQTKRTYYEYTSLWHIYAILSMNAWFWSSIFHTRYELFQSLWYFATLRYYYNLWYLIHHSHSVEISTWLKNWTTLQLLLFLGTP